MDKESKEEHSHHKNISTIKKIRENPWIISTVVLFILVLVMIVSGSFSSSGSVISEEKAGEKVVNFLNGYVVTDNGVSLDSATKEGGLYLVGVSYQNNVVPVYLSLDGKYIDFGNGMTSIEDIELQESNGSDTPSETETTTNVPKSEKPAVELFVMSHCPYGTQAEKGILPVVNLLGDKIDFDIRFVYYAMHPSQGEVEEQLNQYCIQEEQESKFNTYLECFLEEGDGNGCLIEAGIDKTKLNACFLATDKEFNVLANKEDTSSWLSGRYPLFDIDKDLNEIYGIGGSPTLVINGVQVDSGRSPSAMLNAVCNSFSDGNIPEECNTVLPTDSYVPGFGWTLSSGTSTDGAQCY
jgi:hypothetical protein